MVAPLIRRAEARDAGAIAACWLAVGREYVQLFPDDFQVPAEDGLPAWIEKWITSPAGGGIVDLVAEIDGAAVGLVEAAVVPPADNPQFAWQSWAGETGSSFALCSSRRPTGGEVSGKRS